MIKLTLKQLAYAQAVGALDALNKTQRPFAVRVANRKMPAEIDEVLQVFTDEKLAIAEKIGVENKETHRYERIPENKAMYDQIAEMEKREVELNGDPIPLKDILAPFEAGKEDKPWEPDERTLGALEPFLVF